MLVASILFVIRSIFGNQVKCNFLRKNVFLNFKLVALWICCGKFWLLRREYLSSTVNMLTNSPKILDISKRVIFQLNFSQSDETIWSRCFRASFSNVRDTLRRNCLFERCSKTELFRHWSTPSFYNNEKFKQSSRKFLMC